MEIKECMNKRKNKYKSKGGFLFWNPTLFTNKSVVEEYGGYFFSEIFFSFIIAPHGQLFDFWYFWKYFFSSWRSYAR